MYRNEVLTGKVFDIYRIDHRTLFISSFSFTSSSRADSTLTFWVVITLIRLRLGCAVVQLSRRHRHISIISNEWRFTDRTYLFMVQEA